METITALLEAASLFGVFRTLAECTATEVVFIFLCSKPIFVVAAAVAGVRGHLDDGGAVMLPDGSEHRHLPPSE